MPGKEGTKKENYLVRTEGTPICMGHRNHCLKVKLKPRLSTVKNNSTNHSHISYFYFKLGLSTDQFLLILFLQIYHHAINGFIGKHVAPAQAEFYLILPMEASLNGALMVLLELNILSVF